jgi:hypothetical protein
MTKTGKTTSFFPSEPPVKFDQKWIRKMVIHCIDEKKNTLIELKDDSVNY